MSRPSHQPIDLDQVAPKLGELRSRWVSQGLTAGEFTWRDACASWPQAIVADRGLVAEPESLGITSAVADGREGHLIIWRGGWADVHRLTGEKVTSQAPALQDVADCVSLAESIAHQLTITPSPGT